MIGNMHQLIDSIDSSMMSNAVTRMWIIIHNVPNFTMRKAPTWLAILFTLTLTSSIKATTLSTPSSFVAIFDMQGYSGTIEFHSNPAKNLFDETVVRVNVLGPSADNDKLTWSIWERPTDLTQKDPCSADKLGTELISLTDMFGHIGTGNETLIRDTYAVLDLSTLFERTIVIKSIRYGLKACSLIRNPVPLSWTAEARFISPIGGTLVLRHLIHVATGIRANLLWTKGNEVQVPNDARLHWSLVRIQPVDVQRHEHEERLFRQRSCSYLWELMASDQTTVLHSSSEQTRVVVGGYKSDLASSRHTYHVETNFTSPDVASNSEDEDDDLWVILRWSVDEFVACAPLAVVQAREAVAEFPATSPKAFFVRGYVHFYQASGYGDATVVTVNLTTAGDAAGFGIDELSLWPATSGVGHECLDLSLAYFNPLKVDSQSGPLPTEGTTDRYAVGDLSGKMGSLWGHSHFQATHYNQYVTLFGRHGIVGRSLVIYKHNWYPLACANLEGERSHVVAIAKFRNVLDGEVVLRQPRGADTSLLVHLQYGDEANSTNNHMWEIHSHGRHVVSSEHFGERRRKVRRRLRVQATTVRPRPEGCRQQSSVFNPYGVTASSGTYSCDCSQSTANRCALGDLGNRLGTIDTIHRSQKRIPGEDFVTAGGQLFAESGLFLEGDFSIIGLTLVIYKSEYGTEMLDCATIELFD